MVTRSDHDANALWVLAAQWSGAKLDGLILIPLIVLTALVVFKKILTKIPLSLQSVQPQTSLAQ